MGFNISGLVINHNFNKDLKELEHALRIGLEKVEDTNYTAISGNWTPEGEIHVYFTEKSTLLYICMDDLQGFPIPKEHNSLLFGMSSVAGIDFLRYAKKGNVRRKWVQFEGNELANYGKELKQEIQLKEEEGEVFLETLNFKLISKVLGESFFEIDGNAPAIICRKTKYKKPEPPKAKRVKKSKPKIQLDDDFFETKYVAPDYDDPADYDDYDVPSQTKKWWEFWK